MAGEAPTRPGPSIVVPAPPVTVIGTPGHRLPPWLDPDPTERETGSLRRTANTAAERTLMTARPGDPLPLNFGQIRIGANICRAKKYNGKLLVVAVWGDGEHDGMVKQFLGGEQYFGGTHYLGAPGQAPDPTVQAAFGQADVLDGVCYSVYQLPPDSDFEIQAIWRGRKWYDPRSGLTVFTRNPALMLAGIIDQFSDYSPNWDSVATTADYDDELVGGLPRWEVDWSLQHRVSVDDLIATFREYANCFMYMDAGEVFLVPDAPRAVDHVLDAGKIAPIQGGLVKAGMRDVPTQVVVNHTAIHGDDYLDTPTSTDDVPQGTPLRILELDLPGYTRSSMGRRKAVEKLNETNLLDLSAPLDLFDYGLKVVAGDVIDLSSKLGLSNRLMQALHVYPTRKGRWRAQVREYDPAKFSNQAITEPTYADTDLPNPNDLPAGPAITSVTEVPYKDQTGHTYTRFEIRFNGLDFPFMSGYRIKVSSGTEIILEQTIAHRGDGVEHRAVTSATAQDVLYLVEIWAVNIYGRLGTVPSTATKKGDGKKVPPTDVTGLTGREAGQWVNLQWNDAIDTDLRGYEVRRLQDSLYQADPAGGWDHPSAVVITKRVDASNLVAAFQPAGIFYYMVKAKDLALNESDNAAALRIEVTLDAGGAASIHELLEDTLVNMHVYTLHGSGGGRYATTCSGESWGDLFGAGESWGDFFAEDEGWGDHESVASSIETTELDVGSDRNGNWIWTANVEVYGGTLTYTSFFALEADYPTFNMELGQSLNASARYFKAKAAVAAAATTRIVRNADGVAFEVPLVVKNAAGTAFNVPLEVRNADGVSFGGTVGNGFRIKLPALVTLQGRILEQTIITEMPAVGQPVTVVYPESYAEEPDVSPKYIGPNPYFAVADSITETQFALHLWDTSGAAVAGTVKSKCIGT